MAFVIPDNLLEQLICDRCFKYLSVKPVKVYPNRKTTCGRCVRGSAGVESLFGLIAETALFKCVNRYDGCRELLRCELVADHETTCVAEQYKCPLCKKTEYIPTYALLKHVEMEHSGHVLKKPSFVVELQGSDCFDSFFYKIEDAIFCVEYAIYSGKDRLMLRAKQVTKPANIRSEQKFALSYGNEKILTTRKKSCGSLGSSDGSDEFTFQTQQFGNFPFVIVDFDITSSPELLQISRTVPKLDSGSRQSNVDASLGEKEILFSVVDDNPRKKWTPRKIFLNEDFKKTFPGLSLNFKENAIRSVESQMDLFLQCRKCQAISQSADEYHRGFFYKGLNYHYVCFYCHQINNSSNLTDVKLDTFIFEYSIYEKVEYFCSWNCGNSFDNSSIIEHESTCSCQPHRECPMEGCSHKATLLGLELHFVENHKERITNRRKYYFSLIPGSRFSLKKSQHSSRFEKVYSIYYLWVLDVFVRVDISWNDVHQSDFDVKISVCGDRSNSVRPKVVMAYSTAIKIFSKWAHVFPE